jgi:hypothetical protein
MPPPPETGANNHWVTIDVAAEALGISRRRALELAKTEEWRTHQPPRGDKTRQYLFTDIHRTYTHRKAQP